MNFKTNLRTIRKAAQARKVAAAQVFDAMPTSELIHLYNQAKNTGQRNAFDVCTVLRKRGVLS